MKFFNDYREAVNADKYKEIMRNTGYLIIGNQVHI